MLPSASKPTVPETKHQRPSATARLKPTVFSNGDPEAIRRRDNGVPSMSRALTGPGAARTKRAVFLGNDTRIGRNQRCRCIPPREKRRKAGEECTAAAESGRPSSAPKATSPRNDVTPEY